MKFSIATLLLAVTTTTVTAFANLATPMALTNSITTPSSTTSSSSSLSATKVPRNENFAKLSAGYLFPEIGRRRKAFLEKNPDQKDNIVSLGIGDTTQPIPGTILKGLVDGAMKLGESSTYSGYGSEQGNHVKRKDCQRFI